MTRRSASKVADTSIEMRTFFWEGTHTMSEEKFRRVQHIHDTMTSEFCCDRGLVMELVLTELSDEELRVLEKVMQRCREARRREASIEMTAEDRMLEGFQDMVS